MTKPYKIVSRKPNDVLEIGWDPSNYCNFNCRYCFPGSNAATHKNPGDINLIVDNFRHLMDYYEKHLNKTKFHISIAGGEPTLWKDLGEFIEKIKLNHNVYVTLVSNGSRTTRWWDEYGHIIDDVHLTHHIEQGNVEHITKVADILYEKGTKTTVKSLMDPAHWDQAIKDVQFMKKNSKHPWFIMVAQVIEQDYLFNKIAAEVPRYSEEQLKYLRKELKRIPGPSWFWKNRRLIKNQLRVWESTAYLESGKKVNARPGTYFHNGWSNFKGWSCSVGLERICINWTGTISGSCQAKPFNLDFYYNILDQDFKNKFNPPPINTVCPNLGCWCMPETHISKEKIIEIKPV